MNTQTASDPFWSYEDVAMLLACLLPCLLAAGLGGKAAEMAFQSTRFSVAAKVIVAQMVLYASFLGCLTMLLRGRYGAPLWQSLNWNFSPGFVLPAIVSGLALALGNAGAAVLLRTKVTDSPMEELLRDPLGMLIVGVLGTTLGPVCEELAFRGFLMPLLTRSFGWLLGILLAAFPFALLHGTQYAWSWQHIVLITLAGCAFGVMRWRAGSTGAAALMHAAYNSTFFVALLFQKETASAPS